MADRNSTPPSGAHLVSHPSLSIRPMNVRGELSFAVGDVAFAEFTLAVNALAAADAHRLDIVGVSHG
jgi:hypothetical protein